MTTLYIVGTPIGNLEDMTLRAIRLLREVALVASEDTRSTRRLFNHFGISTPLTSYFEHNKKTKLRYLLERLSEEDIALVSEAGMPGISDPGYELVLSAQAAGFKVVAVPGPSAAITALAVSGLPTDSFHYMGFLPRKGKLRRDKLKEVNEERATLIVYEAPHRLNDTLRDIITVLGDRQIAVCRELTKLHEEVFRGTIEQAAEHFTEPRGEFTLVIHGSETAPSSSDEKQVIAHLKKLKKMGKTAREAMSDLKGIGGLSRRDLYELWLNIDNS